MSRVTTGTSLGPFYHGPEVQEALRVALEENHTEREKRLAQAVLDVIYTAMMFGAFRDYEPEPANIIDFPLWGKS